MSTLTCASTSQFPPSQSHSHLCNNSDEKWKLTKKECSSLSRRSRSLSSSTSQSFLRSKHHKGRCSFSRKCANLVKEQRARFYIMRRCVTMLVCWRDYTDS